MELTHQQLLPTITKSIMVSHALFATAIIKQEVAKKHNIYLNHDPFGFIFTFSFVLIECILCTNTAPLSCFMYVHLIRLTIYKMMP